MGVGVGVGEREREGVGRGAQIKTGTERDREIPTEIYIRAHLPSHTPPPPPKKKKKKPRKEKKKNPSTFHSNVVPIPHFLKLGQWSFLPDGNHHALPVKAFHIVAQEVQPQGRYTLPISANVSPHSRLQEAYQLVNTFSAYQLAQLMKARRKVRIKSNDEDHPVQRCRHSHGKL